MSSKLFLSHDHRDEEVAAVIAGTLKRITLGQLDVWFSSDASPSGGIQPGRVWLDEIRTRLEQSKAIIALLTPTSISKPWLIFECGFGAAMPHCEVIPLCVGISALHSVPFPLAMYQVFQLADYDSLKQFVKKLLQRYEISFDEEMAEPVLKRAIAEFTASMKSAVDKETTLDVTISKLSEEIKQHIDRRFLELAKHRVDSGDEKGALPPALSTYSIPVTIQFPNFQRSQFINIESTTTMQDVLDNIYYMLKKKVPPYSYLVTWIMRDLKSKKSLVIKDVQSMIPAKYVFKPDSSWEVINLIKPYTAKAKSNS